ncbi:MAG TPA: hypothetical protein VFG89_02500 [Coriobacteriia bacterium]|nr:hypothetical protein [Coriobacteriia bacterium]
MKSWKHKAATAVVVGTLAIASFGSASTAVATPGKNKSCSSCHKTSSAVRISVKKQSETTTTATYSVTVTGGNGRAGWAVFSGGKNIKHKSASKGTFTVNRGKSYKVRAVKKGSGSAVKTLTVN